MRMYLGLTTLLVAASLLAGCGDDDDTTEPVTAPSDAPLVVTARDFSFDPPDVISDGSLEIELVNRGSAAHNLAIEGADRTKTITEGEHATLKATLEPGNYEFLCTVADHAQRGMRGKLKVE